MTEDFVDVTWRGLEVVGKARLRGTGARSAYLEHATPMPTGTQLTIRTADGLELAAIVARVQEQIGGRTEAPGMEVSIEATGAAATWWLVRAEAHAAEVAATPVAPVAAVAAAAAAAEPIGSAAGRTTLEMPILALAATAPPVMPIAYVETAPTRPTAQLAPSPVDEVPVDEVRPTEVMTAVADPDAGGALGDSDAIPTGIDVDDTIGVPNHDVVDDGRRTMIMPAVDLAALALESGQAEPEATDDDAAGGAAAPGDKKKAKGKRRKVR